MTSDEKIKDFGDMVDATERMSKPWQDIAKRVIWLAVVTNLFWMIIVGMLVYFAYMSPAEMTQEQDLESQHQTQTYVEGATSGG